MFKENLIMYYHHGDENMEEGKTRSRGRITSQFVEKKEPLRASGKGYDQEYVGIQHNELEYG